MPKTTAKKRGAKTAKKLASPPLRSPVKVIVQKEAAQQLGITDRALREWMKLPGFPDWSAGYDIPAIQHWAEERSKKHSVSSQSRLELERQIAEQKLRKETLQANKLAREEEEAKGNILRRDEYETFIREEISIARDQLGLIPRNLCRYVPQKYHKTLQAEGAKEIAKILDQLAEAYTKVP